MSNISVIFDTTNAILERRGLDTVGRVQKRVDSEVLRYCDPYVPFDTGMLRGSGIASTQIGSGVVQWSVPYAAVQYYTNPGKGFGLKGKLWFERMKADHKDDILKSAAAEAEGEVIK